MKFLRLLVLTLCPLLLCAQTFPTPSKTAVTANPDGTHYAPSNYFTANAAAISTALNLTGSYQPLSANLTALAAQSIVPGSLGGTGVANTGKTITLGGNFATSGAFAITLTATGTTTLTLPTTGTLQTAQTSAAGYGITNGAALDTLGAKTLSGSGNIALTTSPVFITPSLGVATATSINGLTPTALTTGFSVAGGTTSKTLTVSNTLTLAGTDASTLNIGAGGTLGTAAFTATSAYVPAYSGLTTNGLLQATSATAVASTLTPSGLTSLGVNSITASASTDLTLSGGSTAGQVIVAPTGTSTFTYQQSTTGRFLIYSASSAVNTQDIDFSNPSYTTAGAGARIRSERTAVSGAPNQLSFWTASTGVLNKGMTLTEGTGGAAGNLLIGGTTDMTGSGGLKVFGNSAATTTTTGALQVPNGGASIGGALYMGGNINVLPASGNAAISLTRSGGASASLQAQAFDTYLQSTVATRIQANSTDFIIMGQSGGSAVNIPGTTSAISSTSGALQIGNGTAATNVAIGGGNIVAGGNVTVGSNATNPLLTFGANSSQIITTPASGVAYWDIASSAGGWNFRNTFNGSNVFTFGGTGNLSIAGTTSASSSTVGAFLVGNGTAAANTAIGGGNINTGGAITVGGASTFSPAARTSGVASYFTVTAPADTGITATAESIGTSFTGSTRTWATGGVALQRERVFGAPTIAAAAASTFATVIANDFLDPVQGTNATITNGYAVRAGKVLLTGQLTLAGGTLLATTSALTNGAAAATATFTNAPTAGNPTKWVPINDAGTTRYIPAF